ncbi:hypothetical protein D3C84_807670 [compost metagenome]
MAHAVAGEAAAQGIAVIAVQNGLRQQTVVAGAVVEEQRTRPILLRCGLFVGHEVGNGRFLLQRQGKRLRCAGLSQRGSRQLLTDKSAPALHAFQPAFGLGFLVGEDHRLAIDVQQLRHFPRAG